MLKQSCVNVPAHLLSGDTFKDRELGKRIVQSANNTCIKQWAIMAKVDEFEVIADIGKFVRRNVRERLMETAKLEFVDMHCGRLSFTLTWEEKPHA